MKPSELTVKAHVRMTTYAKACLRVATWLAPHSPRAAVFVARQAWVWVKLEGCGSPNRWTRHNVGMYLDWQHKGH